MNTEELAKLKNQPVWSHIGFDEGNNFETQRPTTLGQAVRDAARRGQEGWMPSPNASIYLVKEQADDKPDQVELAGDVFRAIEIVKGSRKIARFFKVARPDFSDPRDPEIERLSAEVAERLIEMIPPSDQRRRTVAHTISVRYALELIGNSTAKNLDACFDRPEFFDERVVVVGLISEDGGLRKMLYGDFDCRGLWQFLLHDYAMQRWMEGKPDQSESIHRILTFLEEEARNRCEEMLVPVFMGKGGKLIPTRTGQNIDESRYIEPLIPRVKADKSSLFVAFSARKGVFCLELNRRGKALKIEVPLAFGSEPTFSFAGVEEWDTWEHLNRFTEDYNVINTFQKFNRALDGLPGLRIRQSRFYKEYEIYLKKLLR